MDRAVESKSCLLHTVNVFEQYVHSDTLVVVHLLVLRGVGQVNGAPLLHRCMVCAR